MKKTKMLKSLEKVCTNWHLKNKNNLISKTNKISKSNILAVIIIMVLTIIKISLPLESLGADETADLEISSKEQLEAFRDSVNSGESYEGKTVKLMADINLNGTSWNPIGNETYSFDGTFDGQGYTISGMQITNPNYTYVGLFGNSYKIKNLKITNSSISTNFTTPIQQNVGIISGKIISMENCYTEGCKITIQDIELPNETVNTVAFYIGGLAGNMSKGGIYDNELYAKNCVNNTVIDVNNIQNRLVNTYIGGIIGSGTGEITNCINNSELSIDTYANSIGGIIGVFQNGSIKYCYNIGNITAIGQGSNSTSGTGGISGVVNSNMDVTISNCYNKGNISSKGKEDNVKNGGTGGIIGNSRGEKIKVSNSFNTGLISGTGNQYTDQEQGGITTTGELGVGGIIGNNGGKDGNPIGSQIENCYNIGEISGDDNNKNFKGNIVGSNKNKGTIRNCYYKQGSQYGGYGENLSTETVEITTKTESEMKTEEFVNLLNAGGNEFYLDTNNTNDGYPIFKDITPPSLIVKYSETNTTDQDVTVTITSNEELQALEGWTLSSNKLTLTKTYQENTEETIEVSDLAGNKASVKIAIKNIFKNTTITFKEENMYNAIINTLGEKVVSKNDEKFEITIRIKDLEETTDLNINDMQITNISGIENFTNLEILNMQNNNVEDIKALSTLSNLRILNLNNNKLNNESLKNVENLRKLEQLGIANNNLTEITSIQGLTNMYILNIGGNEIEDITPISNLTKLTQIVALENNINNIDCIKNLKELISINFSYNNISSLPDLSNCTKLMSKNLEGQELEITITGNASENRVIELPDIIKNALQEESEYYSEEGIDVQNGTLQENNENIEVEIYEIATNPGILYVNSGELIGCNLNIYGTTIDYGQEIIENGETIFIPIERETKTNTDVTATIISSNPKVKTSDTSKHLFQTNGQEILIYTDENNEEKQLTATVDFIDKTAPEATVTYSIEEITNQDVTVTVKVNEAIQDIYEYENEQGEVLRDWEISENNTKLTKTYDENIVDTVLLLDEAGNEKEIEITISNIQKEKPEAGTLEMKQETSEGEEYINNLWTNKDVYIKLIPSSKENTKTTYYINGEKQEKESQVLTEEGEYEVIVKTTDEAGNENQNEYQIKIDKTLPTVGNLIKRINSMQGEELTEETTSENVYICVEEGTDELSGHYITTYKINEGEEKTQSQVLTEGGNYTITVITKDKAGNVSTKNHNLNIDKEELTLNSSNEVLENNTVKVTITANKEIKEIDGWTLSEDKKQLSKIYVENKTEKVIVQDLLGNQKEITITVNSIDTEDLIYTTDISNEEITNQNVTVKIIANKELKPVDGWNLEGNNKILTKEYSENANEIITISDMIGNQKQVQINITNIDKEKPEIEVVYSNQLPTNQNVQVTIKANEQIKEIEGFEISNNKKELTKEYEANIKETITVTDLAGNTQTKEISIENIDKQKPVLQISYSNTEKTSEPITVTITANENIQILEGEGFTIENNNRKLIKQYEKNTEETIKVKDMAGNIETATIKIENIIETIESKYEITEEGYIMGILPNTTVADFKKEFNITPEIEENTNIIKTGTIVKINNQTYKAVVIGDIVADGNINLVDLVKIKRHITQFADSILTNENLKAADINLDGEVNTLDLAQIKQIIIGTRVLN